MNTKIKLQYDGRTFYASRKYINSLKEMMVAEIKMLRYIHKSTYRCWYCCGATFKDFAYSNNIEFEFGSIEDSQDIKKHSDIYVFLPYGDKRKYIINEGLSDVKDLKTKNKVVPRKPVEKRLYDKKKLKKYLNDIKLNKN